MKTITGVLVGLGLGGVVTLALTKIYKLPIDEERIAFAVGSTVKLTKEALAQILPTMTGSYGYQNLKYPGTVTNLQQVNGKVSISVTWLKGSKSELTKSFSATDLERI